MEMISPTYIKTDKIFFDGVAWNYLTYDKSTKNIEVNFIENEKTNNPEYLQYYKTLQNTVVADLIGDQLYLSFNNSKCVVCLSISIKRRCFSKRKILSSNFKYYASENNDKDHLTYYGKTDYKKYVDTADNKGWDIIADFININ